MMKLDNFIGMMTGHFDNKEQFNMMQATGKIYPYAKHVNTVCNDKINNIPQDFNGKFVVEESYYETNGNRHASPHLFLIIENEDGILLSSYEIPEGEDKNTFSYDIIHFIRREMLDFTAFPVFFVSNLLLVQRKKYYFNRATVSRNCSIVL